MLTPIRVLCVDDHRIVREGLTLIIDQEPDMRMVGSAATVEEAVEAYERLRPDITLMDLRLRGANGVQAIVAIRARNPAARIIVLTMYEGDEDVYRALKAGAATCLHKDIVSDELVRAVRDVHARELTVSDPLARSTSRALYPTLTPREQEVIELVSQGMRNKEIAASLGIRRETVVVHIRNIFAKLKVNDRTSAVRAAVERGIIHIG